MKLVLIDFCDTFVDGQTALEFCDFATGQGLFTLNRGLWRLIKLLDYLKVVPGSLRRKLYTLSLVGLSKKRLDLAAESYAKSLRLRVFPSVLKLVREYKTAGFEVIVLSAGFAVYIRKLNEELKVFNDVIANEIQFKSDFCKGKIAGNDCFAHEKIIRLQQQRDLRLADEIISLSDHSSDLSMLLMANVPIVVYKTAMPKWAVEFGFKGLKV